MPERPQPEHDRRHCAYVWADDTSYGDVYVAELDGAPRRLTDLNPWTREQQWGDVREVAWPSFDGLEIQGILILPLGYTEGQRYPTLLHIHGGPAAAWTRQLYAGWHDWGTLAQRGYAVLMPNPRGSTGRGTDFLRGIAGTYGEPDFQDLMAGVDWLIAQGIADPQQLVVGGWSGGGFLTNWTITHTDRFKAAISGAGVSNWLSYLAQPTSAPSSSAMWASHTPPRDRLAALARARHPQRRHPDALPARRGRRARADRPGLRDYPASRRAASRRRWSSTRVSRTASANARTNSTCEPRHQLVRQPPRPRKRQRPYHEGPTDADTNPRPSCWSSSAPSRPRCWPTCSSPPTAAGGLRHHVRLQRRPRAGYVDLAGRRGRRHATPANDLGRPRRPPRWSPMASTSPSSATARSAASRSCTCSRWPAAKRSG